MPILLELRSVHVLNQAPIVKLDWIEVIDSDLDFTD